MARQSEAVTVSRSAIQLSIGDRIVAPDGAVHTVTSVEQFDLGNGITTFTTDTGIELTKQGYERREPAYDILTG